MEKVGFVGLGNMGLNMTRNLLKAGFDVTCFDMRAETVAEAEKNGARAAEGLRDAANLFLVSAVNIE